MKHRFFVTIHTLENPKTNKYSKEQKEFDFPDDVNVEAATAEIYAKFGQLGREDRRVDSITKTLAPMAYAVIHGHQLVSPHEKGTMFPSEKYVEQALNMDFKSCLMDSPKLAKKRRKGME